MSQIISALSEVSADYKALFVDLWGCVHNGITAYPDAVAALQEYRAKGGIVVLVTNSPRPRASVPLQVRRVHTDPPFETPRHVVNVDVARLTNASKQ